jgi:hypothetical protein
MARFSFPAAIFVSALQPALLLVYGEVGRDVGATLLGGS